MLSSPVEVQPAVSQIAIGQDELLARPEAVAELLLVVDVGAAAFVLNHARPGKLDASAGTIRTDLSRARLEVGFRAPDAACPNAGWARGHATTLPGETLGYAEDGRTGSIASAGVRRFGHRPEVLEGRVTAAPVAGGRDEPAAFAGIVSGLFTRVPPGRDHRAARSLISSVPARTAQCYRGGWKFRECSLLWTARGHLRRGQAKAWTRRRSLGLPGG